MGAMTLDTLVTKAGPYPTYVLEDAETGLCLFSAAFLGRNDAAHFSAENVRTTCVDVDSEKLEEMADLYPDDWKFICRDAWEFAEGHVKKGDLWDVVNVDPFTGEPTERAHRTLDLWCSLARDAVVIGATVASKKIQPPRGWVISDVIKRSEYVGGVFWLVLTRD